MIKVLLVDDERIVRVGLKSFINWQENGFELIGEAGNGEQALEIIKKDIPDIIITDIKMPVLDGIEFIKIVKAGYPNIKIVVLSCHDEFHIVKEAMKIGADDYFLKLTMEPEELTNILLKLTDNIIASKLEKEDTKEKEKSINSNVNLAKDNYIKNLIFKEHIETKDIKEDIERLNIPLNYENVVTLLIWIDKHFIYEEYSENDKLLLKNSIINIVNEILVDFKNAYCIEAKEGEYLIIYTNENKELVGDNYIQLANKVQSALKNYINISVSIGISSIKENIAYIKQCYQESLKAVNNRYFLGSGSIIEYNSEEAVNNETIVIKGFDLARFNNLLQSREVEKLNEYFDNMINLLNTNLTLKLKPINACMAIMVQFIDMLNKKEEDLNTILYENYDIDKDISKLETLEDIKNWVLWLKERVTIFINSKSTANNKRIIGKIKKYINDNFNQDISLEELAKQVDISPSYLSNLFKQSNGFSITEYITEARIEKAKEYLSTTNMMIYEIAEAVGYNNIYYFSKIFKKVTGVSPIKYKDLC